MAGERCIQLTDDNRCRLFGRSDRPAVCLSIAPSPDMCGTSRDNALEWLIDLERATCPRPAATE